MSRRAHSAGMALVTALFLLIVLSVMAAAMVALSNVSHDTSVKSLQTAKVYYAAKAGSEWGIQQSVAAGPACPAASTTLNLNQAALAGVRVVVTCSASAHGGTNRVYYLVSVATISTLGRPDYAERHVEATVSNIP